MSTRSTQALAVGLMGVLVVLAALAMRIVTTGDGAGSSSRATEYGPAGSLPRPVFISPRTLAEFLLRRVEGITLVDVREPAAYERLHLPGAVNLAPVELAGEPGESLLGAPGDQETIVYADGMVEAFDVAAELIRKGYSHVHVLEGGLDAFKSELLTPPSLRGTLSESRASQERVLFGVWRRFFLEGGHAVNGVARDPATLEAPTVVSTAWTERSLGRVVPIDVREPHEFNDNLGQIEGAELVPLATVPEQAKNWDKSARYVTICRASGRSDRAALAMEQLGFHQVASMVGGMLAFRQRAAS